MDMQDRKSRRGSTVLFCAILLAFSHTKLARTQNLTWKLLKLETEKAKSGRDFPPFAARLSTQICETPSATQRAPGPNDCVLLD
jgi:hypothetical protein